MSCTSAAVNDIIILVCYLPTFSLFCVELRQWRRLERAHHRHHLLTLHPSPHPHTHHHREGPLPPCPCSLHPVMIKKKANLSLPLPPSLPFTLFPSIPPPPSLTNELTHSLSCSRYLSLSLPPSLPHSLMYTPYTNSMQHSPLIHHLKVDASFSYVSLVLSTS